MMNANFWQQKWERGDIGFHERETNPFLLKHFAKLDLAKDSRVFVPLCGKTRDIVWLLINGYRVAGVELSELAINELFEELGLEPEISRVDKVVRYKAKGIDVLVGDIFAMSAEQLGPVNAIYDRAALVALPVLMRAQYTKHLMNISNFAPQLLITYQYNQLLMDGPPFSVDADEVDKHYGVAYRLASIDTRNVSGGMKGKFAATETAWLLQNINR